MAQRSLDDFHISIIRHLRKLPEDSTEVELQSLGLTTLSFAISTLASFKQLQKLDLSDNSFESFPDLSELENLKCVNISKNPVSQNADLESSVTIALVPPFTQIIVSDKCLKQRIS